MTIHVHVHIHGDPRLDEVIRLLKAMQKKEDQMAATLDDVKQKVTDEATVEQSAIVLLGSLSDQLKAALSANDPQKVQDIADALDAEKAALAAAVVANTPAAPPAA